MVRWQGTRKYPRVSVNIPIVIHTSPGQSFSAEIQNISKGGAFVHGLVPVVPGQEILIEIQFHKMERACTSLFSGEKKLPEGSTERALVMWMRGSSTAGFGLQFVGLASDKQEFVENLVASSLVAPQRERAISAQDENVEVTREVPQPLTPARIA